MLIEDCLNELDYELKADNSTYIFEGRKVPRVTEILSKTISEEYLLLWANSLGFRRLKYKDELQKAANIGTDAHKDIELFFKEGKHGETISFQAFLRWYYPIKDRIKILGNEEKLVCQWFGGTYDMLIEIDGRVYLVDFKTSNHVSYRYAMQLAAYRYMLYYIKGINIDGIIILQLHKTRPEFNEYVLDFAIKEHYDYIEYCTRAFLAATYAYYTRTQVERGWEVIMNAG